MSYGLVSFLYTGKLTSEDIRAIIRSELAPVVSSMGAMGSKVDTLSADHVTRSDMSALRAEMQTGFTALDGRFISKELAQQRFEEAEKHIKDVETAVEAVRGRSFTLGNNVVFWMLGGSGLVISLISLFTVLALRH